MVELDIERIYKSLEKITAATSNILVAVAKLEVKEDANTRSIANAYADIAALSTKIDNISKQMCDLLSEKKSKLAMLAVFWVVFGSSLVSGAYWIVNSIIELQKENAVANKVHTDLDKRLKFLEHVDAVVYRSKQ